MKINWGWGIAIGLSCFVGYIIFFLIQALNFNGDLVADDYYDQELKYQDNIEAQTNFKKLEDSVHVVMLDEYVQIDLPKTDEYNGELHLYRPSDASKDRKYPIKGEKVHIPKSDLESGSYKLKIAWKSGKKLYYTEKSLSY